MKGFQSKEFGKTKNCNELTVTFHNFSREIRILVALWIVVKVPLVVDSADLAGFGEQTFENYLTL